MHFGQTKSRGRAATVTVTTGDDGNPTVLLAGELDHEGVILVENEVRWAVSEARSMVTVDGADLQFVDSAGLRLILQAQMMATDRHVDFRLVHPSDSLTRLLALTGLDDLIGR